MNFAYQLWCQQAHLARQNGAASVESYIYSLHHLTLNKNNLNVGHGAPGFGVDSGLKFGAEVCADVRGDLAFTSSSGLI